MKSTNLILTALFAALIAAGCFILIPLPGGIPITFQDMLVMLSGLLLGPLHGSAAVAIFLLLGAIGLPVYTGKAGIQVLLHGPTMGFLWGFLLIAFLGGLALKIFLPLEKSHSHKKAMLVICSTALMQNVVMFACAIVGFMFVTHATLQKAALAVLVPFIPGNVIKIVLMTFLTKKFRPVIWNYTH